MAGSTQPGVLAQDTVRSIVVCSADGELGVAIRDLVPRWLALVRDVRPQELPDAYDACAPWPWLVVGDSGPVDRRVVLRLRADPVTVLWRGPLPEGMPGHAAAHDTFASLAGALRAASGSAVAGMRLAPGLGVRMPGGWCVRSPALEALLARHPGGFAVPARAFRGAARALAEHAVPAHIGRDRQGAMTLREDCA